MWSSSSENGISRVLRVVIVGSFQATCMIQLRCEFSCLQTLPLRCLRCFTLVKYCGSSKNIWNRTYTHVGVKGDGVCMYVCMYA